jgi:hypothetical protein
LKALARLHRFGAKQTNKHLKIEEVDAAFASQLRIFD